MVLGKVSRAAFGPGDGEDEFEQRRLSASTVTRINGNGVGSSSPTKQRRVASTRSPVTRSPTRRSEIAPSTPPHPSSAARTPTSSGSSASSSNSPRLAIKFGGKVFRTLDRSTGATYSTKGDLFGEPDEEVADLVRERGEKRRREIELELLNAKRSRTMSSPYDQHSSAKGKEKETPTKRGHAPQDLLAPPATIRTNPVVAPPLPAPSLGLPFSSSPFGVASTASSSPSLLPLPPPLARLHALHCKLESALVMQLACNGAAVASSTHQLSASGESTLRIPNLINLIDLRRMIESGGRTFGEKELAELLWVWEGCGLRIGKEDESEDEDGLTLETGEGGGMGFVVTRTRASTASGIVSTFGIGISVAVKSNPQKPQYELMPIPTSPSRSPASPSRKMLLSPSRGAPKGREGMSIVALWHQGQEARKDEFGARLREWGRTCAEEECRKLENSSTTVPPFPTFIPAIPRANLPHLVPAIPVNPGTLAPSPKKPKIDVFGIVATPPARKEEAAGQLMSGKLPTTRKSDSLKERRQAMADRIKAKAAGGAAYLDSISQLSEGTDPSNKSLKREKGVAAAWRVEEAARLKRNSMLSRLGTVADGVWMLFDVGRRRSIATSEVVASISKSSRSNLSLDEAKESVVLLCTLCPSFVFTKMVEREEWLCIHTSASLQEAKTQVRQELARSQTPVTPAA